MTGITAAEPSHVEDDAPTDAAPPVDSHQIEPWERPLLKALGEVLEQARVDAGVELRDLEPIVGSASSLRRIERGAVRTRASRLRTWLGHLGVDPAPVLAHYASVIVPDRADGRQIWRPVVRPPRLPSRSTGPLAPPPAMPGYEQAALGAELWQTRVEAGLSRPRLAQAIGCHRVSIWLIERGYRRATVELVDAWLSVTAADVDRLVLELRFPGRIAPDWRHRRRLAPPDQLERAPTAAKRSRHGGIQ